MESEVIESSRFAGPRRRVQRLWKRTSPLVPRPARRPHRSAPAPTQSAAIVAPMQGTVVHIATELGQRVDSGELLLVMEAMKMEKPIRAPYAGYITDVAPQLGQTVNQGQPLVTLNPIDLTV